MFFNNFGWQAQGSCCQMEQCSCNKPIIEQPIERCVERNICHKVEHVCPIHTKVINNHIYEHTYRPEYTYSEEDTVTNIDPGCCGNNM